MKILIKDILLNDNITDVLIEGDSIKIIGSHLSVKDFDEVIEGKNKAILPAFYNLHCHAAMNLLRGYSEDLPLFDWLQKIWAKEATLSAEDIYNGTRLAILEMIKSGTVFFADMYWYHESIVQAVKDMGVRCNVGVCFMDRLGEQTIKKNIKFLENFDCSSSLITVAAAPHAIYTCSGELYKKCKDVAKANGLYFQTHLSETTQEVEDCKKEHNMTPTEYLDSLGVLDEQSILAHCVHLTETDAKILADKGSVAIHNPCSNMKLSSGSMNIEILKKYGVKIALGTDGCSSNNNLSMMEEMKFAVLMAKLKTGKADSLTAKEVFDMATINGAKAYNINVGKIQEGMKADCLLIDLTNERMTPNYNTLYNIVYSADSSCIDTVICNGKILMRNRYVEDEESIILTAMRYNEKK